MWRRLVVPLVVVLVTTLLPAALVSAAPGVSEWEQIGGSLDGQAATEFFGSQLAMNAAGDIIVVGTPDYDHSGLVSAGKVQVFRDTGAGWQQLGSTIQGVADEDFVGGAVAIDDTGFTIAFSTPGHDDMVFGFPIEDVGQVEIFAFDQVANDWQPQGIPIVGDTTFGYFGEQIALSADAGAIVIGAPETQKPDGSAAAGLAAVYDYDALGSVWDRRGFNIVGDDAQDQLGYSVAINDAGNRIFVSAIGFDGFDAAGNPVDDLGFTTAYEIIGGLWTVVGNPIEGDTALDFSGVSIAANGAGDVVVVGAPAHDAPNGDLAVGRVRVYSLQAGTWQQTGSDLDGIAEFDYFGDRVAINRAGNIIVIAAYERDFGNRLAVGSVQAYSFVGNDWNPLNGEITGENEFDFFGEALATNAAGTRIAAGAPEQNSPGDVLPDVGRVRIFGRCSVGASIASGSTSCARAALPIVAPHLPVAGGSFPCVGASPMTPFAAPIFAWSNMGAPVVDYWVYAGSSIGARDYFDSGNVGEANATFMTGLPTDGSTVHVRLYHRPAPGQAWEFADYTYTACQQQ